MVDFVKFLPAKFINADVDIEIENEKKLYQELNARPNGNKNMDPLEGGIFSFPLVTSFFYILSQYTFYILF